MTGRTTLAGLKAMKRAGEKIVGIVVWDTHMAAIADRVGAEIISTIGPSKACRYDGPAPSGRSHH